MAAEGVGDEVEEGAGLGRADAGWVEHVHGDRWRGPGREHGHEDTGSGEAGSAGTGNGGTGNASTGNGGTGDSGVPTGGSGASGGETGAGSGADADADASGCGCRGGAARQGGDVLRVDDGRGEPG